MLPASTKGVGMNIGFPDVCLTPAGPAVVPVPYPNLALNAQAMPFSTTVMVAKAPGLNMGSQIPLTTGDEGGVAHPMIKGPGTYTMGNPTVFVEKLPGINLTCPTKGNGVNNGIGIVAVPSVANVLYSLAAAPPVAAQPDPYARPIDPAAAEALDAALDTGLGATCLLEGGIGLLKIRAFSSMLPSEVWTALRGLETRGMCGLVLDLSGCPGGDTTACLDLASDFLPEGRVLAILREADGDETPLRSVAEAPYPWPVTILVDERTASAAEVFAGCLAFHGRAVLVGTRTFGKGAAQKIVPAEGGSMVAASVAELLLPDGGRIEGSGLTPAILARSPEAALQEARAALREACVPGEGGVSSHVLRSSHGGETTKPLHDRV